MSAQQVSAQQVSAQQVSAQQVLTAQQLVAQQLRGPRVHHHMNFVNSYAALSLISSLTEQARAISLEFMIQLSNKLFNRAQKGIQTVFGIMPAPTNPTCIKQVIGAEGYYFKLTTVTSNVDFIWFDRVNNMFLFWGKNNYSTAKAMSAILRRVNKYTQLQEVTDHEVPSSDIIDEDDEDYSDMPGLE
jgi:hypothetical protein